MKISNWHDKKLLLFPLLALVSPIGIYALGKNEKYHWITKLAMGAVSMALFLIVIYPSAKLLVTEVTTDEPSAYMGRLDYLLEEVDEDDRISVYLSDNVSLIPFDFGLGAEYVYEGERLELNEFQEARLELYKCKLSMKQYRLFPKIRDVWENELASRLSDNGISVIVSGDQNEIIAFRSEGGNIDSEYIHARFAPIFELLRFDRVGYYFENHQSYEYHHIDSYDDDELVYIGDGGEWYRVKP